MLPAGDGPIIGMKGGGPPLTVNITPLLDAILTRLGTNPLEPGKEISLPKTTVASPVVTEGGSLKRKRKLKKHVRFVLKDTVKVVTKD